MAKLFQVIEHHWQTPKWWLTMVLLPWSWLFALVASLRRLAFLKGWLPSEKLPVPVVVIGNIHVGGTGKTPITAALVQTLQSRGINVGIISRGYGRKSRATHVLTMHSTADEAGDEPLLLYQKTNAPVAVAANRVAAGRALLDWFPNIELLIADDGLQHYAMARDMEIAVFPYVDMGRTDLDILPNGALREPMNRLADMSAIVVSDCAGAIQPDYFPPLTNIFHAQLVNGEIYQLNQPSRKLDLRDIKGKTIAAVAAIAKPERFFNRLRDLNMVLTATHVLPDHATITPLDLPVADMVIITEKDAVKLLGQIGMENVWVLPVCAIIQPNLADWVLTYLKNFSGR